MAETRWPFGDVDDEALARALRELGGAIEVPGPALGGATDPATRARARIVAAGADRRRGRRLWSSSGSGRRPLRRGLVLALVALLVLAAIAGAVTAWLPGIRIGFSDEPPPTVAPSSPGAAGSPLAPVGTTLGLGTSVGFADAERLAGIDLIVPPDPAIGPPDGVFVMAGRVSLVWSPRPGLPEAGPDGIGLLISEFRGSVSDAYYGKVLGGQSRITAVSVGGSPGFFISGPPHYFAYVDEAGNDVDASHRVVGDALLWTRDGVTYRLESGLGMDAAIRLAESLE